MKKWLLTIAVLCIALALGGIAQAETYYSVGDRIDDFTVTMSDGTEISLYGLLEEKDAVLINLWATWCGPCRMEFPFMQEAYDLMKDEIGIIALSVEPGDTDEAILAMKAELGLTDLPMGRDTAGVGSRFYSTGIPLSIMVDRNGVFCYQHTGSITSADKFLRLFGAFTGDEYTDPVILEGIPAPMPDAEIPSADELAAALGIDGEKIRMLEHTDPAVWPFLPSEEGAEASNGKTPGSHAEFSVRVTAEAGEGLAFEYASACELVMEGLFVLDGNGKVLMTYGGEKDWTQTYIPLEAGEETLTFRFEHGEWMTTDAQMKIRNLRVVSAEEMAEMDAAHPPVRTLQGNEILIEAAEGDLRQAWIGLNGETDSRTQVNVLQSAEMTVRVRVGSEVDEKLVCLYDGSRCSMMTDLETDGLGYVMRIEQADQMYQMGVFESVLEMTDGQRAVDSISVFLSEQALDAYVQELEDGYAAMYGAKFDFVWEYEEEEQAALPEGMAEYRVIVVDEAGNPIEGVMMQFCDETTCQVVGTDAQGVASLVSKVYPYEVHVLVANGYAADQGNHIMPVEGGELSIVLKAK